MAQGTMMGGTIAAIATAIVPQQGSVGIVRVSGPEAWAIARQIFQVPGQQPWESHRVVYGMVVDPATAMAVDEALLILMQAPRTFTREDVVEFHCHGGMMVVQRVLQLCLIQGARLAQPGEFTMRAFLNGRIDLTQAESVADLVGAQSPQAAQMALAGVRGKLAEPIRALRSRCLDVLAEVEARIDFADDLPPLDEDGVAQELREIGGAITQILSTADRGELLRSGIKVAIVGRPNVGKSSLLNAWSRSDRAIVTDLPGTTRDVVESRLVVGGIPVQVLDTAGIRETEDVVEKIGVARSRDAALEADLVILAIDGSAGWCEEDEAIYRQVSDRPMVVVINKVDLLGADGERDVNLPEGVTEGAIAIVETAAAKNQGIDQLETALIGAATRHQIQATDLDLAINQRQAAALTRAKASLERVGETLTNQLPLDFWTIDLRDAVYALGEITGEEVTESVLGRIFSRFCIGK